MKTKATILLCQETGYTDDNLEALYSWAHNRQWICSAIPARRTAGMAPSGGTAAFVRDVLGLRHPERGPLVWEQRLQQVIGHHRVASDHDIQCVYERLTWSGWD
eukprot:3852990-Pyramimonas_sp.AAC.1